MTTAKMAVIYQRGILIALLFFNLTLSAQEPVTLMDSVVALVSDKQIPLEKRYSLLFEMLDFNRYDEIIEGCSRLLDEARAYPDKKHILSLYTEIINNRRWQGSPINPNYIDSVLFYINQTSDPGVIGKAYNCLGDYYNIRYDHSTAHSYYYKAIQYLEQSLRNRYLVSGIYNYIASYYLRVNDYINLKKIEESLFAFASKYNDQEALVRAYCVKAADYGKQFENNPDSKALSDSVLIYELKVVEEFEKIAQPSFDLATTIAYDYQNLAHFFYEMYEMEGIPNHLEKALEYIEKSIRQADPDDIVMQLSYHDIRGNIFLKQGKLKQAEIEAQLQLKILSNHTIRELFLEYREMYDLFSKIEVAKGNYREALKYEKLKNEYDRKIFDTEKFEAVEQVKTQYEVSKKEDEIKQLSEINRAQH